LVGLRRNFAANPKNVDSPEEPEKMRVKRDPSPGIKLRDSLLPTGWTHVSAFRHLIHLHRLNGMLRVRASLDLRPAETE
jgi:hypothetical protein